MLAFRLLLLALITLVAPSLTVGDSLTEECKITPTAGCEIRSKELNDWLKLPNRVVVDVRDESEHNAIRVPESLNFPAFSLKYKERLKDKSLLIIGAAHQRQSLLTVCEDLHKHSFTSVRVLIGGIESWRRAGLDLAGDRTLAGNIQPITPNDLVVEFRGQQPRIITPEVPETKTLLGDLGTYISWPDLAPSAEEETRIHQLVLSTPEDPPVILLHPASVKDSDIEGIFTSKGSTPYERTIFYVKGGYSALTEAIRMNESLLDNLRKLEEPRACR